MNRPDRDPETATESQPDRIPCGRFRGAGAVNLQIPGPPLADIVRAVIQRPVMVIKPTDRVGFTVGRLECTARSGAFRRRFYRGPRSIGWTGKGGSSPRLSPVSGDAMSRPVTIVGAPSSIGIRPFDDGRTRAVARAPAILSSATPRPDDG